MSRNPVGWLEIDVEDLDRAKAFDEAVFKVELTRLDAPTAELRMLAFPADLEAAGSIVKAEGCAPNGERHARLLFLSRLCRRSLSGRIGRR
ncbi:hypothetical protein NZK35_21345 [Stieleria sp. ICT_E10.1]|nr:hypothetical protein [Stieleria sedimenti]